MGQLGKGRDEMKKFLAMTLVVLITVASGLAQVTKPTAATTFVNKTGVQKAATGIKATALISAQPPAAGYLPPNLCTAFEELKRS
jgi:hypothetical protein